MTGARTKQHEEEKQTYRGKDGEEGKKEASKKSKKIVLKASIVTKLPVSATIIQSQDGDLAA